MHLSQPAIIFCIFVLLVPLWVLLKRDFARGLAYAVFLCVLMPTFLRINISGGLPQLTIFRLVLISVLFFWLRRRSEWRPISQIPLFPQLCLWSAVGFVSLLLTSITFTTSLKRYLDFVLEIYLFYVLLATTIRTSDEAFLLLRAAWLGLTVVAVLAVLERYTNINPVYWLVSGEEGRHRDIVATYQHRILLGAGMAMAFPLAFGFFNSAFAQAPRPRVLWISFLLFCAVSYFAQSRGPWLAAMLAGGVLMLRATRPTRQRLMVLGLVAMMALASRPGVWETLSDRVSATADSKSFKGGTMQYRLELWKVAWAQVTKSMQTFFFGYGPGCGSETEIDWTLSYRGQEYGISSWDNQLAYDLFQSGFLGLIASLILYGSALLFLYRAWVTADPANRDLVLTLFASALALVFMMTNVLIFAKQLYYLFWTLVATAPLLARKTTLQPQFDAEMESELDDASPAQRLA